MLAKFNISQAAETYATQRYGRPKAATGTISRQDAAFLYDLVVESAPKAIGEIGVASGVSTAFLSTLLADRLPESRLYSFDRLNHLYDDPSKPVGTFVHELFNGVPRNLTLAGGVGSTAIRDFPRRPEQFDFVFIDASHFHPWPCIDLLSILDLVKPGAWIVLHDIWLPLVNRNFPDFGPLYLYQLWPGEKRSPTEGGTNIGALRSFADPADTAAALIRCCRLPWQHALPADTWNSALQALAQIDFDSNEELRSLLEEPLLEKKTSLRDCEISLTGLNPWSTVSLNQLSEQFVLHANRRNETGAALRIRGIRSSHCTGAVFPRISRAQDTELPIEVTLSLRSSDTFAEAQDNSTKLVLRSHEPHFCFLQAPAGSGHLELEVAVRLGQQSDSIHGAWVKFEGMRLV